MAVVCTHVDGQPNSGDMRELQAVRALIDRPTVVICAAVVAAATLPLWL